MMSVVYWHITYCITSHQACGKTKYSWLREMSKSSMNQSIIIKGIFYINFGILTERVIFNNWTITSFGKSIYIVLQQNNVDNFCYTTKILKSSTCVCMCIYCVEIDINIIVFLSCLLVSLYWSRTFMPNTYLVYCIKLKIKDKYLHSSSLLLSKYQEFAALKNIQYAQYQMLWKSKNL